MRTITKYVNEVTGEEFDSLGKAQKAEKKSKAINKMFDFVQVVKEKVDCCNFGNGEYCVQRSQVYYDRLRETIDKAVKVYEPEIHRDLKKHKEYVFPFNSLGRYLGDYNSEIHTWYCIFQNICPKCYREWGQGYFALNCPCNGKKAKWPEVT